MMYKNLALLASILATYSSITVESTYIENWSASRMIDQQDAAALITDNDAIVNTPSGPMLGLVFDNFRVFQGVPYANAPIGNNRFQHSSVVTPWAPNTFNATVEGPGCMQICTNDEPPHVCPTVMSEDCLYMNIWTPRAKITEPVPVILFIHGGKCILFIHIVILVVLSNC